MASRVPPLVEGPQLERALALARLTGAAMIVFLGPLFPNVGIGFVMAIAAVLLLWTALVRHLAQRGGTPSEQERLARIAFFVDTAVVVYVMWVFSADPLWTAWTVGVVIIIASAFRFGSRGAAVSAALLTVAYVVIVGFRVNAYAFPVELNRVAFHVTGYLITALLMTALLRELETVRAAREHGQLHDSLTGLPNRALLRERLARLAGAGRRAALLLIDLRDFKAVNDGLGHDAGDALLRQIGPRLRDEIGPADTIARVGGDEFAILALERSEAEAVALAGHVLRTLERPFVVDGEALDVGAHVGIALAPEHGTDADRIVTRADIAMYAAKGTTSGYSVYSPGREPDGMSRLAALAELRRALESGALVLHYQPVVQARTGQLLALEALVRWRHPERGLVAPAGFIPLAEQTGLIRPLTHRVIDDVLGQIATWKPAGPGVPIAVNLSPRSVVDPQFPEMLERQLARWGVGASQLRFEVTESVLIAEPKRALATLSTLREMGLGVSLDDFGTGYSSLSYLHQLPLDELKIDRSFVAGMRYDSASATIVRATIELGHSLGLSVVAEGVEDEWSRELLASLGCDGIQGFFVARPMPVDELAEWARPAAAAAPRIAAG